MQLTIESNGKSGYQWVLEEGIFLESGSSRDLRDVMDAITALRLDWDVENLDTNATLSAPSKPNLHLIT